MDRMDIPSLPKTKTQTIMLLIALCVFVYVNILAFSAAQMSSGFWSLLPWGLTICMTILTLRSLLMFFEKTSSHLLAADPPVLVTTITWFGKFSANKRLEFNYAAWVRVRRETMDTDLIIVEIGSNGYQTSPIHCYPYSNQNVSLAIDFCDKVAVLLKLVNKGYVQELGTMVEST